VPFKSTTSVDTFLKALTASGDPIAMIVPSLIAIA
jgi:hypothetical protein